MIVVAIVSSLIVLLFVSYFLGQRYHFFRQLLIGLYLLATSVYCLAYRLDIAI